MSDERPEIKWGQIAAGALAAVSSAVLLSTLGVGGTLVGAALGSVVASVASTLYTRGLDAGREHVVATSEALRRVTRARVRVDEAASAVRHGDRRAETELARAEEALHDAEAALEDPAVPGERASNGRVPWRRILRVAAGVFLTALVLITAFELLSGRAVSTYTGGSDNGRRTTVPGLGERTAAPSPEVTPSPTRTPGAGLTADPSSSAVATPSLSPTTSISTSAAPTTSPSSPSLSPSLTPTGTPSVTASPSPATSPTLTGSP